MPPRLSDRVLVTGASGQLGQYLVHELVRRGVEPKAWSGQTLGEVAGVRLEAVSLADSGQLRAALEELQPSVIIHAGAMSAADDVRRNPALGRTINTDATMVLADWAGHRGARLIYTSTDLVFDGSKAMWTEEDATNPLLEYGRTKSAAEPYVQAAPGGVVARVSLLYGPTITGRPSFFTTTLDAVRQGQSRQLFTDEWRTPLDYRTAAEVLCGLALDHTEVTGVLHLGGPERISRYDLLLRSVRCLGLDAGLIVPALAARTVMPEPRPQDVSLGTAKLRMLMPEIRLRTVEEVIYS